MALILFLCVRTFSNVNEEMKQQSSELTEQLKLKVSQNGTMGQELDELRKRLEMADVMLQQVTRELIFTLAFNSFLLTFLFLLHNSVTNVYTNCVPNIICNSTLPSLIVLQSVRRFV